MHHLLTTQAYVQCSGYSPVKYSLFQPCDKTTLSYSHHICPIGCLANQMRLEIFIIQASFQETLFKSFVYIWHQQLFLPPAQIPKYVFYLTVPRHIPSEVQDEVASPKNCAFINCKTNPRTNTFNCRDIIFFSFYCRYVLLY